MPRRSLSVLAVLALAGCGGGRAARTPGAGTGAFREGSVRTSGGTGTAAPGLSTGGAQLVRFVRTSGVDPLTEAVAVGEDGDVVVRLFRGGGNGHVVRFRLRAAELASLRRDVRSLADDHVPDAAIDVRHWTYTVQAGTREPRVLVAPHLDAASRPAIDRLTRIIETSERS